jgi:hypothetical protein
MRKGGEREINDACTIGNTHGKAACYRKQKRIYPFSGERKKKKAVNHEIQSRRGRWGSNRETRF